MFTDRIKDMTYDPINAAARGPISAAPDTNTALSKHSSVTAPASTPATHSSSSSSSSKAAPQPAKKHLPVPYKKLFVVSSVAFRMDQPRKPASVLAVFP